MNKAKAHTHLSVDRRQKDPGLLQSWKNENRDLQPYINLKAWYLLVQYLLRSLKSAHAPEETESFLQELFPRLFMGEVPYTLAAQGLSSLRSRLLELVIREYQQKNSQVIDDVILQIVGIFDSLFRQLNTSISGEDRRQPAVVISTTNGISKDKPKSLMTMRIEGNRFDGLVRMDRSLKRWLGLAEERLLQSVDWQMVIHKNDFGDVLAKIRDCIENRQPVYELVYRLKTHDGNWKNVLEIGRILVDNAGQPQKCTAIIAEMGKPGEGTGLTAADVISTLLDTRKDAAFLIPEASHTIQATQQFSTLITKNNFSEAGTPHKSEPLQQVREDNPVITMDFWEVLAKPLLEESPGGAFRLTISQGEGGEKTIAFHPYKINFALDKPHYLYWAKVIDGAAPRQPDLQRLARLHQMGRELNTLLDSGRIYHTVLTAVRELIPAADAAALLLTTDRGFMFGLGYGYLSHNFGDRIIIERDIFESWQKDPGIDIRKKTAAELQKALKMADGASPGDAEASEQLLAFININGKTRAILQAARKHTSATFSETDRHVFGLLGYFCQSSLDRLDKGNETRETEMNYRKMFEHSQLAMWIVQEGQGRAFNRQFCKLMEVTPERAAELPASTWIHLDDLGKFRKTVQHVSQHGTTMQDNLVLTRKDGREIPCSVSFIPIDYHEHPAVLLEAIVVDTAESRENVRESRRQETVGRLTSGVAHDFNNAIGTIIPNAQLILRQPENAEENRKRADIIYQMAKRAASLMGKVLDFSNRKADEEKNLNLNALVNDSRQLIEKMVGPEIRVRYDLAPSVPEIRGNAHEVAQVLINLAANAREAMPSGGELKVQTRLKKVRGKSQSPKTVKPGSYVCLTVQDSGAGVPLEVRKEIFRPFFDKSADDQNNGLGLSVIYAIIKKHAGYLLVQSIENQGTAFHLYLPASMDESPAAVSGANVDETSRAAKQPVPIVRSPGRRDAAPTHPETARREQNSHGCVLVIDDEPHLREVYETMLEMSGFSVMLAADGREGVKTYFENARKIDLVILDYGMPGLNGEKVFYALKKINPAVRVILCTGYGEQRRVTRLVEENQLPMLTKPFTLESLTQLVEQVAAVPASADRQS